MTSLVMRRALLDYGRRPLNLVLLVAVPVVIVLALGGELANMSKLLSTTAKPAHLEVATAGWAAAAVAGLAGFFQVVGSRAADRRLAASSTKGPSPVVAGRLVAALGLAAGAAMAALVALVIRGWMADPSRAIPTVALVGVLYVAIGVLVGTLVRSEMNGALIVSVIWMLDVFVGSGVGGSTALFTRIFPLHFPTMILTSQAARHGGPLGDVGWALIWAAGLFAIATMRLTSITRSARPRRSVALATSSGGEATASKIDVISEYKDSVTPASATAVSPSASPSWSMPTAPFAAGIWAAVRDYRRNRVLWVLLVMVPVMFIALAAAQTPTRPMTVALLEGTRRFTAMISLRQIHAGEMANIASALLAGVAGLFVVTGSTDGDRRLVLAGLRPRQVLAGHLGVIAGAALLTSAVSLAVSAAFFSPRFWAEYAGADLLIALTYAMVGVLLGPLVGRLGGLYLLLLLSIVDVGYGQTVMFNPLPPAWGAVLPSHGAARLLVDGSFTSGFEQYRQLLLALGWLAVLSAAAIVIFRHQVGVRRPPLLRAVTDDIAGNYAGAGVVRQEVGSSTSDAPAAGPKPVSAS